MGIARRPPAGGGPSCDAASGVGGAGRLRRRRAAGLVFLAVLETIAVAVHLKDVDVMGEPIERGTRQALGAEHGGPLVEWQIAGDDGGATLVALAEDLEQEPSRQCLALSSDLILLLLDALM